MDDTVVETDLGQPLFADLVFTIIPNSSFSKEFMVQMKDEIIAHGGSYIALNEDDGRITRLESLTHIISTTSDFPDYSAALNKFIHVVKPTWIQACLDKNKVANPRAFIPDPAFFMSDVVVCTAGIPEGDKEAIIGGVIALGGQHSAALSKLVTHLVALDFLDPRCQMAASKKLKCHIVLPHWFDDCLRLGRKISERVYNLPDPEILAVLPTDPIPSRASPHIRDATMTDPTDVPTPRSSPAPHQARPIQAFSGKSVMLSEDLDLNTHLRATIEHLIKNGGGQITSNVDRAHIYVCKFRSGQDYIKASKAQKDVGNLSWLYYLIAHNEWTSPMRRMLHYPVPPQPIPGFEKFRISISNFTGDARIYLESLVKATGAEFTKTFRQDNTHLITAHTASEKCEAAKEWNIHVINHLWLEESYARCQLQTLTDSRYTHFPPRTNLGEILGQTEIDRDAVDRFYIDPPKPKFRKDKNATLSVPEPVDVPGSSDLSTRVSSDPSARSTPMAKKIKRTKSAADAQTPITSRLVDGKENETPGTTGSRGAKDRALSKLHDAAPDIAQFEKEMKRKGGVIHGGRRDKSAEVDDKSSKKASGRESTGSKRSFDEMSSGETSPEAEEQEETGKKSKKAKKGHLTPIKHRILLTLNKERWDGKPDREAADKTKLRDLGLFFTEDPKNATLLCAPRYGRTKKFVAALASAPALVSTSYIDYALKHNKLPPPEKHQLLDRDFEKRNNIDMLDALERAQQNKKRLLKNWAIFCTDAVTGGFDTFKDIINANGGECHLWKGRASVVPSHRSIAADTATDQEVSQNQEEDEGDVLYLISEAKQSEFELWRKFREMAKKHDMVPRIVKTEWLLSVAMSQYVHWDPEWELKEESVPAEGKGKK